MSKITLKQIEDVCRSLNTTVLTRTSYGIKAIRKGESVLLTRVSRKAATRANDKTVYEGSTKECMAYLTAIRDTITTWYPYEFKELSEMRQQPDAVTSGDIPYIYT